MRIDLIGSGGREAAIKWKLEKDGHVITDNYPDLAFVGPATVSGSPTFVSWRLLL